MQSSFKRHLAILLIIAMIFTTQGVSVFATGISDANENQVTEGSLSFDEKKATHSELVGEEEDSDDENSTDVEEPEEEQEEKEESEQEKVVATPNDAEEGEEDYEQQEEAKEEVAVATPNDTEEKNEEDKIIDEETHYTGYIEEDFTALIPSKKNKNKLFKSSLENYYDSRTVMNPNNNSMSIIPGIKDQGNHGVCWAFATLGLAETSLRKKGLVTTEEESDLSELALSYFTYNLKDVTTSSNIDVPGVEGNDYTEIVKAGKNYDNYGGNVAGATLTMSTYAGAVREDKDPILEYKTAAGAFPSSIDGKYAFNNNDYEIQNVLYLNKNDRDSVKQAIKDYGAVSISFFGDGAGKDAGGYDHVYNGEHYYYPSGSAASGNERSANHAIIVVGWDDNIPAASFSNSTQGTSASHDGGWLCKNSWGDYAHANDGFFWMSYDEPSIRDNMYALEMMDADTYEYNYHYDTTTYTGTNARYGIGTQGGIDYSSVFSNIYKAKRNETLDAVSLVLGSTDNVFDIKIYTKDSAMNNPTDGTLRYTQSNVSRTYPGMYTIKLDDKITLGKDTYYSIVIMGKSGRDEDGNNTLLVGYDFTYNDGSIHFVNESETWQSYDGYYAEAYNYYNWEHVPFQIWFSDTVYQYFEYNWRIRGLTNPVAAPDAYIFGNNWFDSAVAGFSSQDISTITFLKYNENEPTGSSVITWDLPASTNGLVGYKDGTAVYIKAPADAPIKVAEDASNLFGLDKNDIRNVTKINNLNYLDTSEVKNMSNMFYFCKYLQIADFSNFDTSNVTNMERMFFNCSSIQSLDLSSFDTSHVTSMSNMFNNCNNLISLNIASFDTSNVTNMSGMFSSCNGLTTLNLNHFNTSKVTDMTMMFYSLQNLKALYVKNFDTSNVLNMNQMFYDLRNIRTLDLRSFDTSKVECMTGLFNHCLLLERILASDTFVTTGIDTTYPIYYSLLFSGCTNLKGENGTIYNSSYDSDSRSFVRIDKSGAPGYFSSKYDFDYVLSPGWYSNRSSVPSDFTLTADKIETIEIRTYGIDNAPSSSWDKVGEIDGSSLNTTYGKKLEVYYYQGYDLEKGLIDKIIIYAPKVDDSEDREVFIKMAEDSTSLFAGFVALESITGLAKISTEDVTSMSKMFRGSFSGIDNLDLSSFDTRKVTDFSYMFETAGIKTVNVSSFDTSAATNMECMFCDFSGNGLTELDLSNFDTSNVINMMHMISAPNIATISVSNFNTSKVENFEGLFYSMRQLTYLDVSSFDTSSATNMRWMFNDCPNLVTIVASSSFVAKGDTTNMFDLDVSLIGGRGTTYEDSNPKDGTYAHIDSVGNPGYFTSCNPTTLTITKVEALSNPTKTTYNYGDTIDLSGLRVKVYYDDGSSEEVEYKATTSSRFAIWHSIYNESSVVKDSNYIIVKYEGVVVDFNVLSGETFDTPALYITINNTPDFTSPVALRLGHTYPGVADWELDKTYEYNLLNHKSPIYFYDDEKAFDESNYDPSSYDRSKVITGYLNFGMGSDHSMRAYESVTEVKIPDGEVTGTDDGSGNIRSSRKMSFMFRNNYIEFYIHRNNDDVSFGTPFSGLIDSIEVTTKPTKQNYVQHEKFEPDGLVIKAIYKNGSNTREVEYAYDDLKYQSEFSFSPTTTSDLLVSNNEVEISFRGKTCMTPIVVAYDSGSYIDVTFDADNGTPIATVSIPGGTKVVAPNEPTKTGYTFKYWYIKGGADEAFDFANTNIDAATEFVAKWEIKHYKLYFYKEKGSIVSSVAIYTATYSSTVMLPTIAEPHLTDWDWNVFDIKEGYEFDGWELYIDATTYADVTEITPDDSVSSYRIFLKTKESTYPITLHDDGGTYKSGYTKPTSRKYTVAVTLPTKDDITKTGYVFKGWYNNNGLSGTPVTSIAANTVGPHTYWLKWNKLHTVTFDLKKYDNAGNGTDINATPTISEQRIEDGTKATKPTETPTAANHEFLGWYLYDTTTHTYSDSAFDFNTLITADTTIYAKWHEVQTITFSFDMNGHGTAISDVNVVENKKLTKPTDQAVKGYKLIHWYEGTDDTVAFNFDQAVDPADGLTRTLHAKWKAVEYTINYDAKGGTLPDGVKSFNKTYDTSYTLDLATPSLTGYTFDKWYKDDAYNNVYDKSNDDIYVDEATIYKIYAKWIENTYSITLNDDGGTYKSGYTKPTSRKYTVAVTLPTKDDITKTGYVFKGWYDNNGLTGTPVTSIAANTVGPHTFWLKWNKLHTVTFDLRKYDNAGNGTDINATPTISDQSIEDGTKATKPTETITATGYKFLGWYHYDTNTHTYGAEFNFATENITNDTIIYAKWEEKSYNIILNVNGGTYTSGYTRPTSKKYTDIAMLPTPSNISKAGYTFGGWYDNDGLTGTVVTEAPANVEGPYTYWLKWNPNEYDITLYALGGTKAGASTATPAEVLTYKSGEGKDLPTDYERDGYQVVLWYDEYNETTNTYGGNKYERIDTTAYGNKILYARYGAKYTITYDANGGNGNMSPSTAYSFEDAVLKDNTFTRSGYSFSGWEASNGNRYSNKQNIGKITSDLTLRAIWNRQNSNNNSSGRNTNGPNSSGPSPAGLTPAANQQGPGAQTNQNVSLQQTMESGNFTKTSFNSGSAHVEVLARSTERWTYDPVNNKWGITGLNGLGQAVSVVNSFCNLSKLVDINVNGVVTQVEVNDTYYFDETGNMVTGWLQSNDGKWYFFNDTKDANEGKMSLGWKQVGGQWYYFNADGSMLTSGVTPDGYAIDASGTIINQ